MRWHLSDESLNFTSKDSVELRENDELSNGANSEGVVLDTSVTICRYQASQGGEEWAERGGAGERAARRGVHLGAASRRRVFRLGLRVRERVRQWGVGGSRDVRMTRSVRFGRVLRIVGAEVGTGNAHRNNAHIYRNEP